MFVFLRLQIYEAIAATLFSGNLPAMFLIRFTFWWRFSFVLYVAIFTFDSWLTSLTVSTEWILNFSRIELRNVVNTVDVIKSQLKRNRINDKAWSLSHRAKDYQSLLG